MSSKKLRIIVAEDDTASRLGLARAVRSLGHECRVAGDGEEAWQLHRAEAADVVLSDWEMPRLDGPELCRRIRALGQDAPYTYFIMTTGCGDKAHFLRGMEAGADDYQTKPVDTDELEARLVSAGRVVGLYRRLESQNARLRRDSAACFRQARVDPLTGLGNRLRMDEDLATLFARARRYGEKYCVAICDVDHFKQYNDHYGHAAGDDLLRRLSKGIRLALRVGDAVYRYGGDELLVVLPEQSLAEAAEAMHRVRHAVERLAVPTVAERGVVTISVGVAQLSGASSESLAMWLARADRALYEAKSLGRDRVEIAHAA